MLKIYKYRSGSVEWKVFCDAMERNGHRPVVRYERATPSDPAKVWPMDDHYLTDRGEKCWPWVIFATGKSAEARGYVLDGVAPLPEPIAPPAVATAPPKRKKAKKPQGKSAKAAEWFVRQAGRATRAQAAEKFGISQPALCVALSRMAQVPKSRRESRSARAARWLSRHPEYSRFDAARLFNVSYGSVCRAIQSYGFNIRPVFRDLIDSDIDKLRRVKGLFDDDEKFEIRASGAGLKVR